MSAGRPSRYKAKYVWWFVLFLSAILLSANTPMGQRLGLAMAPLVHIVQSPVRWYEEFSLWFVRSSTLQSQYQQLQQQVAAQSAMQLAIQVLETENTQLRHLLNIAQMDGFRWQAARVISRGQEERSRQIMLQIQTTKADDIVVSHEGLVGLVDSSSPTHAVVRTILDASIAVPVTKAGSQLAALVRGDGEHLLVDFVSVKKAPAIGDILITSGSGGMFPAGLPVARVDKVSAVHGGVFVEVIASPVAYWERDAWLAVVVRQQP